MARAKLPPGWRVAGNVDPEPGKESSDSRLVGSVTGPPGVALVVCGSRAIEVPLPLDPADYEQGAECRLADALLASGALTEAIEVLRGERAPRADPRDARIAELEAQVRALQIVQAGAYGSGASPAGSAPAVGAQQRPLLARLGALPESRASGDGVIYFTGPLLTL